MYTTLQVSLAAWPEGKGPVSPHRAERRDVDDEALRVGGVLGEGGHGVVQLPRMDELCVRSDLLLRAEVEHLLRLQGSSRVTLQQRRC